MFIFATCTDIVIRTKFFLPSKFVMKGTSKAVVVVGVRLIRKDDSIILFQEHYVDKLH